MNRGEEDEIDELEALAAEIRAEPRAPVDVDPRDAAIRELVDAIDDCRDMLLVGEAGKTLRIHEAIAALRGLAR